MRIAMLTNNYKPVVGGVPISIHRLATSLRNRGHEISIFAPHCDDEVPEFGVIRYRSRKSALDNGMVIPDLTDNTIDRHFSFMRFDAIHVHHPMMIGYTALALSRKYNIPMAFTYHTRYEQYLHYIAPYQALQKLGALGKPLCGLIGNAVPVHNRIFSNACDVVFAPTPMIRDYLVDHGTISPIVVLPTGLGEEDFAWDEDKAAALRSRYLDGKKHLLCSVARLEKEKNISFLLRALARYKEQAGSFSMLFLGEGTQKEALHREAADLGIGDDVHFLGNIPHEEISSYYRACDLFLFASKSETQGIVLLEGMAAGLPVVAVEASGVCDAVQNGYNGWMTPEDETAYRDRLRMVLSEPALLTRMSAAAGETAKRCTADAMAASAEANYQWMIMERREAAYNAVAHERKQKTQWSRAAHW